MRFIDEALIEASSGHGGGGCVSFRRERCVPRGGPDGGDGGKGGDVVFEASDLLPTLYDFRLKKRFRAKNGQPGQGQQRVGRGGDDLVVKVPLGTLVYGLPLGDVVEDSTPLEDEPEIRMVYEADDAESGEPVAADLGDSTEETLELLADLSEPGQRFVALSGGRGGKGNLHFKSSTMRAPRFSQPGESGQTRRFKLVLKVLADVGLIGEPNAGKSTLIAALSKARPKIAAYPFTTLYPNLGALENDYGDRFVMADVPGLVLGAAEGKGLGHRFLKHVERSRVLVHLLSMEAVRPRAKNPFAAFSVVEEELAAYDPALLDKPRLKVVNKIDLVSERVLDGLREKAPAGVLFISAAERKGIKELKRAILQLLAPQAKSGAGEASSPHKPEWPAANTRKTPAGW